MRSARKRHDPARMAFSRRASARKRAPYERVRAAGCGWRRVDSSPRGCSSELYSDRQAVAAFAAGMATAAGYTGAHHPHARFGPANCVTTIRVMLVALIVSRSGAAVSRAAAAASTATAVMAVLDGVDGWLRAAAGWPAHSEARFDMETDAALSWQCPFSSRHNGKAGVWVLIGGMMRYLFVIAGWRLSWMASSR